MSQEVVRSKSDAATLWVTYDNSDGEHHPQLDGFRIEAHTDVTAVVFLDEQWWNQRHLPADTDWVHGETGIKVDRFRFEIGG